MRTALIDIGSNTIRLVIYERTKAGSMKELDNIKVVARLRKFIQADNHLSEAGIQLLTAHLMLFKDVIDLTYINGIFEQKEMLLCLKKLRRSSILYLQKNMRNQSRGFNHINHTSC